MVAIIFFQGDVRIWLTIPPPPVRICPLLSDLLPFPLMCAHPLWMTPYLDHFPGLHDLQKNWNLVYILKLTQG